MNHSCRQQNLFMTFTVCCLIFADWEKGCANNKLNSIQTGACYRCGAKRTSFNK